jgi:DNA-binding Lrp family transcriptional regulator
MLSGEIDFILRCVAPDLNTFQALIIDDLTAAPNVASVKTSLVIRASKHEPGAPLDLLVSAPSANAPRVALRR